MSTTRKITIKGPDGNHIIKYPDLESADAALKTIAKLNQTKRTIVPCDIETGITEKVVNISKYSSV